MKLPYVFGHRGGMGHCIENTISCFQRAIYLGIGIESDAQLTKDKILICFHDPFINLSPKRVNVKDLTFDQLRKIQFDDGRNIPSVREVFETFIKEKDTLRYSFDIKGQEAGQKLINLAKEYQILHKLEITERSLLVIKNLRNYCDDVVLVHTLNESIGKITIKNVDFSKLNELGIKAVNLKGRRANFENLKIITDNHLQTYAWDINKESRMEKILNLTYNDQGIAAIYTDFPELLLNIINRRAL